MPGEVLYYATLREVEISENLRGTSIAQLAVPASQALSPSLCQVLFIPSKHHVFYVPCFSTGLALVCAFNQSESMEVARNCSTPLEVF